MSMRKPLFLAVVLAAGFASGQMGMAQGRSDDLVPRQAADLPERLQDTGERAPERVPDSSAGDVGDINPAALRFGVGRPASAAEIAELNIDVMPGGVGAPGGSGTFKQGAELYIRHCAACHGENLEGISGTGGPQLIGGRGTLDTDKPVKTVESYWPYASTLFDYTKRAMPFNSPGSLTDDEVYAISAYILGRAEILDKGAQMNADTFAKIKMPNVNGFRPDPRPDTPVGTTGGPKRPLLGKKP